MDRIMSIAEKYNLVVIEDAAQSIDSYYKGRPLGSIGHLATFSFHETKNVISGEGGLLVVNDPDYMERAEIIWEKGTNRAAFMRGEIQKYNWVDVGSSFLPSEIVAAFLYAQLEQLDRIQKQRKKIWKKYHSELAQLEDLAVVKLPVVPEYATVNGHMFFIQTQTKAERDNAIEFLNLHGVMSVFHYLPLHLSPFYKKYYFGPELKEATRHSETILRLPFYYELTEAVQNQIINTVLNCFSKGDITITTV
jgi:dTDP-4-amino-4,6-dideoxygalactose transaminase